MSSFGLRLSGGAGAQEAGCRAECVRSVLLLLLLARHPRSDVCCAVVGRAKEEREEGELGMGAVVGLTGAANSDNMRACVTLHPRGVRAWIPEVKRPDGGERGATTWGSKKPQQT